MKTKEKSVLIEDCSIIFNDENQREISFNRGLFYYLQQSYLVYECKVNLFAFNNKKIKNWRSAGIFNYSDYYSMNGIEDTKTNLPILKNNKETCFITR